MRAKIDRFPPTLIAGYLNTRERAALSCGCCMYVGINRDNGNASTATQPCSEAHELLTDLAREILASWLPLRGRRPLVTACQKALTEAAKQA